MGKLARKKQKTGKAGRDGSRALGTQSAVAEKDDEERRLESLLFGVPFVPSGKDDHRDVLVLSDDEEPPLEGEDERELENMADADLFFIDDGAPTASAALTRETDLSEDSDRSRENSDEEEEGDDNTDDGADDEQGGGDKTENTTTPRLTSTKAPVWTDPDDATLQVSLASDKRLRKLRDGPSDDAVGGREYERRLRRQYQKINPTPDWASKARQKLHPKRRRVSSSGSERDDDEEEEEQEHDVSDLLSSTNGILRASTKSAVLPQGTLAIERLRDANQSAKSEGQIKVVQFHPSPDVPVLLTASSDRRLRLFNVDGLTNPHLQTLHVPTLPLTNALFHPNGLSVLLTGPRPFYFTYDLQSGSAHCSSRGLWGTTFNRSNPSTQDASMQICAFSPTGNVLAVGGRHGYVHLVDWKSGAGQVVGSLKMNVGVKSVWWARGGGGGEGRHLMSLGDDAEVYVWDVGERRCVRRWRDDGGFGSLLMSGDRAGKYLAIGSNTGLVNVYGPDRADASRSDSKVTPLKCIGNLTTAISSLRFNHDSQLLAMASNTKKDQMRLIHLPSLTAFANWPTSSTPLGHVTSVDFSARSDYVAVGNNRGRVLLYHLRSFASH